MFKKLFVLVIVFACSFSSFGTPMAKAEKKADTVDEWFTKDGGSDEQPPVPDETVDKESAGLTFTFFKMLLALAFIVFLIYVLAKFVNKRTKAYGTNKAIETVGGVSIGQNRSIQLVRVGDRLLVVGVGDSIQLLKELTDESEIAKLLEEQETSPNYEDMLSKSKQWLANRKSSNEQSFTSVLNHQLKSMTEKRKNIYNEAKKESENE